MHWSPCYLLTWINRAEREVKKAEAQQQQPAAPVIQQVPTIVYQGATTITAMQVRKEKEAELFANDQYWANRLANQQAEFTKNSKIMEKEFNETVSWKWRWWCQVLKKMFCCRSMRWRNVSRSKRSPASSPHAKTLRVKLSNATDEIRMRHWSALWRFASFWTAWTAPEQLR